MARLRLRIEQVALVSGMTLAALNLCTGVPLLGLWVGSRATGDSSISMLAVLIVVATMVVAGFLVVRALTLMEHRYRAISGQGRTVRRQVPWLRSMRGARAHDRGSGEPGLGALDYILVLVVVATIVAFEVWFFFLSGSPIDSRSGR